MTEEFEESEVVFRESVEDEGGNGASGGCNFPMRKKNLKGASKRSSVPVNIPARNTWYRYVDADFEGDDDGEIVPPHIIIGRRVAGKMMAFAVCSGNGRTLKGRDLSEVRNSILRMTGFLET